MALKEILNKISVIFIIALISLSVGCGNSKSKTITKNTHKDSKIEIQRDKLVNYAKKQLGVKYLYGGMSPKGFDCSGFTKYVFAKIGYNVPRVSRDYAKTGKKISVKNTKKGDILLFTGSNKHKRVTGHLGIVVSNKNGVIKFIHASSSRGIVISDLKIKYYQERILGARQIIK
jgi:cell wall-associated NlpC family hydrolase